MGKLTRRLETIGAAQTGTLIGMAEAMAHSPVLSLLVSRDTRSPGQEQHRAAATTANPATSVTDTKEPHTAGDSLIPASRTPQTRESIERHSLTLDDFYSEGQMHPVSLSQAPSPLSQPIMYEAIAARISQWTQARDSQVLCIELPYNHNTAGPSLGSSIASYVVSSAWEVQYPILSCFCTLPRHAAPGRTVQTMALCEMMASLVRQCVSLLPDILPEQTAGLDEARFQSLDGTLKTWPQMLGVLAQLLSLVPEGLLIAIHGLQCLDSRDTTDRVVKLLDVIRERIEGQETERTETTKLLLVNEGKSRAVGSWLKRGELSLHEGDSAL